MPEDIVSIENVNRTREGDNKLFVYKYLNLRKYLYKMEDHYATLGVSEKASQDDIKNAYRKLAFQYHPDKKGGNKNKFQAISSAYEHLEDPQKRRQYDMARLSPFGGLGAMGNGLGNVGNADEILKMFFGGGMPFEGANVRVFHGGQAFPMPGHFQMGETVAPKPRAITKMIEITLAQAYSGVNVPIDIERIVRTTEDRRTEVERLYIDIPKGTDENEIIIVPDKGNIIGSTKGDVKINIRIHNNSEFTREGLDLIYLKQVNLKEALIGFSFEIKHLSGKTYRINNKDGKVITDKYKKIVNFMGMKRERAHPASPVVGDLIIKFQVIFPETLTDEQKKVIEDTL